MADGATARVLTDEERRAFRSARHAVHREIRAGIITKPTQCQDCGDQPPTADDVWSYFPDPVGQPVGVQWLCRRCYSKHIRRRPTRQPRRLENRRKCPPYAVMKRDFVVRGMSTGQMAVQYGFGGKYGRVTVWATLKRRAEARGEWPLVPARAAYGHKVRAVWIWALVMQHLREQVPTDIVYLARDSVDRFAPRCLVPRRLEVWPTGIEAVFHNARCKNVRGYYRQLGPSLAGHPDLLLRGGGDSYEISRQEAEDWGYRQCHSCSRGMSIVEFAHANGFDEHFLYMLNTGRQQWISRDHAKQFLRAIGEPVPEFLLSPGELGAARREARRAQEQQWNQEQLAG